MKSAAGTPDGVPVAYEPANAASFTVISLELPEPPGRSCTAVRWKTLFLIQVILFQCFGKDIFNFSCALLWPEIFFTKTLAVSM